MADARCSATVFEERGNYHQCTRKGVVVEEDKLWCRRHAPSATAARISAQSVKLHEDLERERADYAKMQAQRRLEAAAPAMLEALRAAQAQLSVLGRAPGYDIVQDCVMGLVEHAIKQAEGS